jgi:thiol:disulfide interchange protein DsbD
MKSMKYIVSSLLSLFISTALFSQILTPVEVNFKLRDLGADQAELVAEVIMDEGWHVYSVNTPDTSFIIGCDFIFQENPNFVLIGGLREPEPHTYFDEMFQENLMSHSGTIEIVQRVRKLSTKPFSIEAEFTYQTCNDETCLPPDYIEHSFELSGARPQQSGPDESTPMPENEPLEQAPNSESVNEEKPDPDHESTSAVEGEKLEIDYSKTPDDKTQEKKPAMAKTSEVLNSEDSSSGRSMWGIFLLAFLGGFAALLTPCVFPMIPLTVSFFTKQSKNRARGIANAITYGIAIIFLYTLIGFLVTVIFGSDALNALSTNPWMNLFFFALLVIFAISFFGAFEITLPSSWVNKTDRASDKGGIVGIFFMAFTLALVSFSCTGPIIGTLLVEAASGGYQGPLIGMFGFSLALALPFALFAAFPGWLNSLPKSGGWLNNVKVVLGFVELAFAFKFLSTADLVWQAHILPREWFIAIWIGIGILLTMYLLGAYRMPHDSPNEKTSVFKLVLAIITLSFTVYLVPGLWGAPLKLISGFPPPMFYSESPNGFGQQAVVVRGAGAESSSIPDGADPEHCPLQLNCFHDFETGRAYAKEVNKPILIDFTGWGCVNCRKMEEQVWSDPRVLEILRNEVVLISLYVDEREKLPKEEQYVSPVTGKKIRTVGNKWSEFQIKHFKSNSQPQYLILGHDSMKPLNGSTAYDPDVQLYVDWLHEGISRFEAQN